MKSIGIDIGSRRTKVAVLEDNELLLEEIDTTNFILELDKNLDRFDIKEKLAATGYGRNILKKKGYKVLNELKAEVIAANYFWKEKGVILDIGGQDLKVLYFEGENIKNFVLNNSCASGTGSFLEHILARLKVNFKYLNNLRFDENFVEELNVVCAVFAEAQIVSLLAQGFDIDTLLRMSLNSVAKRAIFFINKLKEIEEEEEVLFLGKVAGIEYLKEAISYFLGKKVTVKKNHQFFPAIGAAKWIEKF